MKSLKNAPKPEEHKNKKVVIQSKIEITGRVISLSALLKADEEDEQSEKSRDIESKNFLITPPVIPAKAGTHPTHKITR